MINSIWKFFAAPWYNNPKAAFVTTLPILCIGTALAYYLGMSFFSYLSVFLGCLTGSAIAEYERPNK